MYYQLQTTNQNSMDSVCKFESNVFISRQVFQPLVIHSKVFCLLHVCHRHSCYWLLVDLYIVIFIFLYYFCIPQCYEVRQMFATMYGVQHNYFSYVPTWQVFYKVRKEISTVSGIVQGSRDALTSLYIGTCPLEYNPTIKKRD